MPGIMADNDVQGQFKDLLKILGSATWRELWESTGLSVVTFPGLGLEPEAPDALVWQTCQAHEVVLFTGNRNDEGPDSLEATIRLHNRADSLPVVTLSDSKRFLHDRAYMDRVAEKLLDILLDLDKRRGAGRLYVP